MMHEACLETLFEGTLTAQPLSTCQRDVSAELCVSGVHLLPEASGHRTCPRVRQVTGAESVAHDGSIWRNKPITARMLSRDRCCMPCSSASSQIVCGDAAKDRQAS
jgi:hypothetical protein